MTPAPLFVSGRFTFRPVVDDDVALLVRWLNDPRVGEWWEGVTVTYDEAYVQRELLPDDWVTRVIVEHDGEPIGFQQWYALDGPEEDEWRAAYGIPMSSGAYGIDQFIGESRLHGRGLGSAQVRAVSDWLLGPDGPRATFVVTDPVVENERAVRAYEKAGFERVHVLPAHETIDGEKRDSWLMEKRT